MLSLKNLAKLKQKKFRRELGYFVVEGKRAVQDALNSSAKVEQLIITDRFQRDQAEFYHQPIMAKYLKSGEVLTVNDFIFASITDTKSPQGIAAVIKIPSPTLADLIHSDLIAVLEDLRDPGNLGTIIRTADWFGVGGLLLVGGVDPYQPKVVRASMGSLFHLPLVQSVDIVSELAQLKALDYQVIVTRPELASTPSSKLSLFPKTCLIFGSEAHGTSTQIDNLADQSWSIPQFGHAESLNVAVSFGITLYELRKSK